MGWYHSKNILDGFVPNARLTEVVEPWFLGNEASSEDKASFKVFVDANPNVKFLKVYISSPHVFSDDIIYYRSLYIQTPI